MPQPPTTGREWHMVARSEGWPRPDDFVLREAVVPEPGPGQVLVRNTHLSVDPYMRGRMTTPVVHPALPADRPMDGGAVGTVLASNAEGFAVGDHVVHGLGWREYVVVDARRLAAADPAQAPLSAYLGALGMPGLTAYAGLLEVASFERGDAVRPMADGRRPCACNCRPSAAPAASTPVTKGH
jgi:NADPH-dependent curcumin reductase CurA